MAMQDEVLAGRTDRELAQRGAESSDTVVRRTDCAFASSLRARVPGGSAAR